VTHDDQLPPVVLVGLAGAVGAALVLLAVHHGLAGAAIATVLALGLLVPVRVPWGGSVPVGSAPIIAAAALLPRTESVATLACGVLLGTVVVLARSRSGAVVATQRYAASAAGALVAIVVAERAIAGDVPTLAAAVAASAGLVIGDLVAAHLRPDAGSRMALRSVLPVHLTLACAGTLIAVAAEGVGMAMALVAAFPLLITRFSFDRYAGATTTLEQTVQALGLVPELAGIAPVGHSERSAAYAVALARELGLDRPATTRVVTAVRLHHIGGLPHEGEAGGTTTATPAEVAAHSAQILREAGLSVEIADSRRSARADVIDAVAPTLEAAVVRIASTFDDIVGTDHEAADRGLSLVSGAARDPHSRRVVAALLELVATGDGLVRTAIAAGEQFREAAVGLDLESVTGTRAGAGELLPFARRG